MTGFGGTSHRPLMRDLARAPRLPRARPAPPSSGCKVNLMARPGGDRRRRPTATPTELDAECALVADAPFAETFMTARVARASSRRRWRTGTTRSREEYVARRRRRARAPSTAPSSTAACCCRSTRPTWPWSATRCSPTGRSAEFLDVGRAGRRRHQRRPRRASTRRSVRLHVCWGNYEGPHTHDVALDEIQPLLYEAHVGALVVSMANARHAHEHRLLRAAARCPTAWCWSPA